MRRFRRRRRGAAWSFADQGSLVVTQTVTKAFLWLMPPARVNFLLNTGPRPRDSMTFVGAHLWLDFYWQNTATSGGLPDVDFACFKTIQLEDDSPDFTPFDNIWTQPATPAALTSWNEDDDDGTFGFLWSHHIKGMSPPNAGVITNGGIGNQFTGLNAGTSDTPSHECRKFFVTQEWQPDVVIRSKRRLRKSEGIVLAMAAPSPPFDAISAICNVKLRTLTK